MSTWKHIGADGPAPRVVPKPPEVVLALLTIAGCTVEYRPERWNRGARKRHFWKVGHVDVPHSPWCSVPYGANLELWQHKVAKLMEYVNAYRARTAR